ncbi:MAG TPA: hypothetical protein PKL77_00215 [Candidatus Omnitrophota bacterium]|nr:hypothetical protein [Candidatus Omnitrophota bacterium]HPT06655.1 hypothetical protein [Candidatus Omnitrophota bacterium]
MNKNAMYLAVFGVLCVIAGVLVGAGVAVTVNSQRGGFHRPDFAERAGHMMGFQRNAGEPRGPVEMLARELNLNVDQKEKVTLILEKARQQIEEVGKNIRSSMHQIKEKSDAEIMGVLTPSQQEKFKLMKLRFEKRFAAPRAGQGQGLMGPQGERGHMEKPEAASEADNHPMM